MGNGASRQQEHSPAPFVLRASDRQRVGQVADWLDDVARRHGCNRWHTGESLTELSRTRPDAITEPWN